MRQMLIKCFVLLSCVDYPNGYLLRLWISIQRMPLCKIIACAVFYKIGVHTISGPYWSLHDTIDITIYFTSTTIIQN